MEGALILPSEEDNNTFSINFSTGEVYKVRASEAKERQVWVDKLRACSNRTANSKKTFVRSVVMSPSSQNENFDRSTLSPADAFNSVNDILMGLEFEQYEIAKAIDDFAFTPRPDGAAPLNNTQDLLDRAWKPPSHFYKISVQAMEFKDTHPQEEHRELESLDFTELIDVVTELVKGLSSKGLYSNSNKMKNICL